MVIYHIISIGNSNTEMVVEAVVVLLSIINRILQNGIEIVKNHSDTII